MKSISIISYFYLEYKCLKILGEKFSLFPELVYLPAYKIIFSSYYKTAFLKEIFYHFNN